MKKKAGGVKSGEVSGSQRKGRNKVVNSLAIGRGMDPISGHVKGRGKGCC